MSDRNAEDVHPFEPHFPDDHVRRGDPPEPLFTLEQARVELAKQECGMVGHDFDVVQLIGGEPSHVLCSRCGTVWAIGGTRAEVLAELAQEFEHATSDSEDVFLFAKQTRERFLAEADRLRAAIEAHEAALRERFRETGGDPNDSDLALWRALGDGRSERAVRPERVLLVHVAHVEQPARSHPALLDSQALAEADLVISYDDAGRCKVVKSRVPVEAVIT